MREELVFSEYQRFRQWWVIPVLALAIGFFVFMSIKFILSGQSGNDTPLIITIIVFSIVILLSVIASVFFIRLETEINKEGVYYRMFPFRLRFKFIHWDQVSGAEVLNIHPAKELFGFGISMGSFTYRFSFGDAIHTIYGKKALKLVLITNKKIYIGTQRPDELLEFLEKLDEERKQDQKLRSPY